MRKVLSLLMLGFILCNLIPSAVFAMPQFQGDDQVYVTQDQPDDTYAAGGVLNYDSTINGDLVVAGGNITIKGKINGDLIVAGGNIDIEGDVADDVRVAGGTVKIQGKIGDDLFAAGGNISVDSGSEIGGSAHVAGGQLDFQGSVKEDLDLAGGQVIFGGNVSGNAKIESDQGLIILPPAKISGNLHYLSEKQPTFDQSFVGGTFAFEAVQNRVDHIQKSWIPLLISWFLFSFLSTLALGILIILVFPYKLIKTAQRVTSQPWASLGHGFVFMLVVFFASIISFMTLIGFKIGLLFLIFFGVALLVAGVFNGYTIAYWISGQPKSAASKWRMILFFALGLLIYEVIQFIPLLGWIACLIFSLMNIGAIYSTQKELYMKLRKSKDI